MNTAETFSRDNDIEELGHIRDCVIKYLKNMETLIPTLDVAINDGDPDKIIYFYLTSCSHSGEITPLEFNKIEKLSNDLEEDELRLVWKVLCRYQGCSEVRCPSCSSSYIFRISLKGSARFLYDVQCIDCGNKFRAKGERHGQN